MSKNISLLECSASELAQGIRRGVWTSCEVVKAHIEWIQKINPQINAVVEDRFERAIKEAEQADQIAQTTKTDLLPPFHGVPCTIKECFEFKGMPHTSGLRGRQHIIGQKDATTVDRLRKGGAIPLGVTNISEMCMWMESDNPVYGRCSNPYDLSRTAGGSSGGEGATIGAGGSPFGLGSDIGGSIRLPAFFNGIFGHKPTGGMVPATGQFPLSENEALRYLGTGPLARRAEDLMPLLKLLAGPDGEDPSTIDFDLFDPHDVELKGHKVYVLPQIGHRSVSRDMRSALRRTTSLLKGMGANVQMLQLPLFEKSLEIFVHMLVASQDTQMRDMIYNNRKFSYFSLFSSSLRKENKHTSPVLSMLMAEGLFSFVPKKKSLIDAGHELRDQVLERLGHDGILLAPSYTRCAPRHGGTLRTPFDWVYTGIFNMLQLPVTQVPTGLQRNGLPTGVQVVGAPGQDHRTIAFAMALEKETGGWVPPWKAAHALT